MEVKLACEFIINLYGKASIAYHLIYLFAKLEELTQLCKSVRTVCRAKCKQRNSNTGSHHSSVKCTCLCLAAHRIMLDKSVYQGRPSLSVMLRDLCLQEESLGGGFSSPLPRLHQPPRTPPKHHLRKIKGLIVRQMQLQVKSPISFSY